MNAAVEIDAGQPKPERFWRGILLVALLLFVLLPFFATYQPIFGSPLDRMILHWYAAELRAGRGMVFNPGQPVLLVASPAYILLLSGIRLIFPDENLSAMMLFFAAQVVGAYSLYRVARRTGLASSAASVAALLYGLAAPLWSGLGSALPVMSTLCLLALDLALSGYWAIAGFTAAIAVLCSPEALLPVILLLVLAANQKTGRRYGLALVAPLALSVFVLCQYYGDALWSGLLALKGSSSTFDVWLIDLLYIPLIGLAALGWFKRRSDPIVAFMGAWAILHIFIFGVLLRQPGIWQYAPVSAPLILLAVIGLRELKVRPLVGYTAVIVLAVIPNLMNLFSTYEPFGPVYQNIPLAGTIGVQTTFDALRWRGNPDQTMISFDGLLQPDLKAMIERGDIQSALIKYAPDVLITDDSGHIQPKMLSSGAWAPLNYQLDEQSALYRRTSPIGQFVDQIVPPASAQYGPDIRLTRIALDQAALSPGQLLRVRLDWDFARSASTPVTVELRLESGEYVLAYAADTYAPSIFRGGAWSTYHTLTVDPRAWPGPVTLTVGVIINNGTAARLPVAPLPITAR